MTGPFPDLRSYLLSLEAAGQLKHVRKPVDKDWEIACIARLALEGAPAHEAYAIQFDQVVGHESPVAVNLYTTQAMYAAALGVRHGDVLDKWVAALEEPIAPIAIESGPVHEMFWEGDRADLNAIPAPVWTPGRDAGPYLSAAVVITKDPETGIQNLGTYRIQIHDGGTCGVFFGSRLQHGAMHHDRWRERGLAMPVAIVVGAPPAVSFAAGAKTAYGVDEMTLAGGLTGAGVEVVRGKTVDLLVPAHAECVIEGFLGDELREEGPFGEALGYMNDAAPAPVMRVTAITQRSGVIHHGYVQQLPPSDGHKVMEMGVIGPLWYYVTRRLKLAGIADLAIAQGSAGVAALVVQVKRSHVTKADGIGRSLARLNFGQKFITLVDEDIDIRDPETLQWALSSRVDPARDITLMDDVSTFQLDPSIILRAETDGLDIGAPPYRSSLAVINATVRCGVPEVSLPGKALMLRAEDGWHDTGLPPLATPSRLKTILENHSESDLHDPGPPKS